MAGATIVFCDLVGFSEHDNDKQKEIIYRLNAEVTHELYPYLATLSLPPQVIILPTGDGMAVVLLDREASWKPVLFSLIDRLMSWALSRTPIRIGVHVGQVTLITDVNRRPNVCGGTINVCQRVMDAAHANQVLFSHEAYCHYVGRNINVYTDPPFSPGGPAHFRGPVEITSKHGLSINVYVMHRTNVRGWVAAQPEPYGDIMGKVARTRFIVEHLRKLCEGDKPLTLYEQSAFSTFGLPAKEKLLAEHDHTPEYVKLLAEQKALFDELARQERTQISLIINPVRAAELPGVRHRIDALLEWLTRPEIRGNPNIDFVEANYEGPNRIIVTNEFCIEGYKLPGTRGYELSIVQKEGRLIEEAIDTFNSVFKQARKEGQTKEAVIASLEALRGA